MNLQRNVCLCFEYTKAKQPNIKRGWMELNAKVFELDVLMLIATWSRRLSES